MHNGVFLSHKESEVMSFAKKMNGTGEDHMLSKVSQVRQVLCVFSHLWKLRGTTGRREKEREGVKRLAEDNRGVNVIKVHVCVHGNV
jgi:hypothetical protein